MVIGHDKNRRIAEKPLLNFYFEAFEKTLSSDCYLLIIGYSFKDLHVNNVIKNNLKNKKSKISIVTKSSLDDFRKKIEDKELICLIDHSLCGFYSGGLTDANIRQLIKNVK